jgi:hypothetical protein
MANLNDQQRAILPIPDPLRTGLITYDARDSETKYPPIEQLRPPKGAPNVLIILLDDAGFGAASACCCISRHNGCESNFTIKRRYMTWTR